MSSIPHEGRAIALLSAMIVAGIALLAVPWFLTPPAYLDLALRDGVFGADLSRQSVIVTEDTSGRRMSAAIEKIGGIFVARVGRINSGTSAYSAMIPGYKRGTARVNVSPLQAVRVPMDLEPAFGRLELSTVDATQTGQAIAATVKEGSRTVTSTPEPAYVLDLPPGKHRLSGQAPGFCPSEHEYDVIEGKVTKGVLPLSPDLKSDEIARFVLGWINEPHDLDTHFRKSDAVGFPSPKHVFFKNKLGTLETGANFARLDVDELFPGKYETLTVRGAATGEFRYFIHAYQGSGTIGDAGATVSLYTRGCQVRTFKPPPNCTFRVWDVATLRYDGQRLQVTDTQTCGPEGTVVVNKDKY
jgi:hypothetical protein